MEHRPPLDRRCIIVPDRRTAEALAEVAPLLRAAEDGTTVLLTMGPLSAKDASALGRVERTSVEELLQGLPVDARIPAAPFRNPGALDAYRIALALRILLTRMPTIRSLAFHGPLTSAFYTLKWRRLWREPFAGIPIALHQRPSRDAAIEPLSLERRKDEQREAYCRRYADACIHDTGHAAPPPAPPTSRTQQTDTPLVSVIIPYYEAHRTVDDTLASLLASTYPRWEAILVNDGSTSDAALQAFARLRARFSADSRFHFVEQANRGLAGARNAGIAHARGDFILPLDSDDLIMPTFLSRGVEALQRNPDLSAVSCFATRFADGTPPERVTGHILPYDLDPVLIAVENRAGVSCSLFRRSVFNRCSYDESFRSLEDWDFWWVMAEAGLTAEVMPEVLYRYRQRSDSLIHSMDAATRAARIRRLQAKHRNHLRQYGDEVAACYAEWIQEWEADRDRRVRRLRVLAPLLRVAKGCAARLRGKSQD